MKSPTIDHRGWKRVLSSLRRTVLFSLALIVLQAPIQSATSVYAAVQPFPQSQASSSSTLSNCQLQSAHGNIQHVIVVQFDNTHFTRDIPNVPSDLEQMPHLLNFIEGNGVLFSNHHTPLISHTATDILTTLTGVYPDLHGVPVSNSYRYFNPNGTSNTGVSFGYWTNPIFDPTTSTPTDTTFNMLTEAGKNAPAPWVPFTRAGCNFGAAGTANMVIENTGQDITKVFGANSPEAAEAKANGALATTDFVGIAVHCAAGDTLCSGANQGKQDLLPDEPGGYSGFYGLFGHKYVAPQISPTGPLTDLSGNVIQDSQGHAGFPGFDGMSASVSLAYVAAMQEHGVPITYAYISDVHDAHPNGPAYGPGQAGYVAALRAYDQAFDSFFKRLSSDGINSSNTLFVFTADEGDHFVGGAPSPANCDGVNIPCTYSQIGEINGNLTGLLATQQGITTPFRVHSDSAPTVYINGNPARTDPVTRGFARGAANLTAVNPMTGKTDTIIQLLADPVEMKLLHMVTADSARTPTLTLFGDPNYFLFTGASNCSSPCVTQVPSFAWNHGDVSPDITTTWLGMVGPGVAVTGVDSITWSDHTDVRPTIMTLVGLKDDYAHDGRVLFEDFQGWAVPSAIQTGRGLVQQLAQVYKQINAPMGQFGVASLKVSTKALKSNAAGDTIYAQLENQLSSLITQRNTLAAQIKGLLEGAAFNGQRLTSAQTLPLVRQAQALIDQMNTLASAP